MTVIAHMIVCGSNYGPIVDPVTDRRQTRGRDRVGVSRAEQAYQMRLKGMSPSEISAHLQYSDGTAVTRAINERFKIEASQLTSEERESMIAMEMARLDALQAAVWDSAMYGEAKAVDTALKIIQTRVKVAGLDQIDTSTGKNTVLVIGGQQADYVESLKQLVEDDSTDPDDED